MATVAYAARPLRHVERAFEILREDHADTAHDAAIAIQTAVELLAAHPLIGIRRDGDIRELVISYGKTGFVVLYRFLVPRDEVRVLALRHQRELGFIP